MNRIAVWTGLLGLAGAAVIAGSVYELSSSDPPYVPWFTIAGNATATILNTIGLFVLWRKRERVGWDAIHLLACGVSATYVALVAGFLVYSAFVLM